MHAGQIASSMICYVRVELEHIHCLLHEVKTCKRCVSTALHKLKTMGVTGQVSRDA